MALQIVILCFLAGRNLALDTVQYGAFLPAATYSVARQLGFFTEYGLDVVFNQVPNSTAAFSSILSGEYDILSATADNALNYRFNQKQNVTLLGQVDQGTDLVVASIPSITSIDQLRGKPIIVDSPTSGYVYLLRKVLSTYELELDNGDYYFMTAGGTAARYSALLNGALPNGTAVYASILGYPVTVEGQSLDPAESPNILARVSDVIAPIASTSFTIRESSLSDPIKSELLIRFVASMYAARTVLFDSQYKNCSIAAIAAELEISTEVASLEYASVTDSVTGEVPCDFTISPEGIMNVVKVREDFNGFGGVPADFNFTAALMPGHHQLIDYSVRDAALLFYQDHPFTGNCTALCAPSRLVL